MKKILNSIKKKLEIKNTSNRHIDVAKMDVASERISTRLCQGAIYHLFYAYQNEEILSTHKDRTNLFTHEAYSSAQCDQTNEVLIYQMTFSTNRFIYQMTGDVIMRAKSIMFTRKRYILNNDVIHTKGGWYFSKHEVYLFSSLESE